MFPLVVGVAFGEMATPSFFHNLLDWIGLAINSQHTLYVPKYENQHEQNSTLGIKPQYLHAIPSMKKITLHLSL